MQSCFNRRKKINRKTIGFPVPGPTIINITSLSSTSKKKLKLRNLAQIPTDSQRRTRHKISNFHYPISTNLLISIKSNPLGSSSKSEILRKTTSENDLSCNLTVKPTQKPTLKTSFMALCSNFPRLKLTKSSNTTSLLRTSSERLKDWSSFRETRICKRRQPNSLTIWYKQSWTLKRRRFNIR